MSISAEQVADLREGDVVEVRYPEWPQTTLRGPLVKKADALCVGDVAVHWLPGNDKRYAWMSSDDAHLTVVSRAPRPLYVNHDRTEPVRGDVVRQEGIGNYLFTGQMRYAGIEPHGHMTGWVGLPGCHPDSGPLIARRPLRLLVDGETGQVVP